MQPLLAGQSLLPQHQFISLGASVNENGRSDIDASVDVARAPSIDLLMSEDSSKDGSNVSSGRSVAPIRCTSGGGEGGEDDNGEDDIDNNVYNLNRIHNENSKTDSEVSRY